MPIEEALGLGGIEVLWEEENLQRSEYQNVEAIKQMPSLPSCLSTFIRLAAKTACKQPMQNNNLNIKHIIFLHKKLQRLLSNGSSISGFRTNIMNI